jgi:DHA2 family multidrug resistance protein
MGVSFVTTWVARRSQFHQSILVAHVTPERPQVQQFLDQTRHLFRQGGSDWTTATRQAQAKLYAIVHQQASLLSFMEVFRLMGLLFLAAIPLIWLMRRVTEKGEALVPK